MPDNLSSRVTNSRGEAIITYRRDSDETGVERVRAATEDGPRSQIARFYWAREAEDGDMGSGRVVVTDTTERLVVVHTAADDVLAIGYDENDHFFLRESGGDTAYQSVSVTTFEESFGGVNDNLNFDIKDTDFDEVNIFRLTSPS